MVSRPQKMGTAPATVASSTPSSVNGSTTTLKDAVSTDNTYCHYLGALATSLDRVARMPKLIMKSLDASITQPRSSSCAEVIPTSLAYTSSNLKSVATQKSLRARLTKHTSYLLIVLSQIGYSTALKFGDHGLPTGDPDYLYRTNIDDLRHQCKFDYGPLKEMFPSFTLSHFPDTTAFDEFDGIDYTPHNFKNYPKNSGWRKGLRPHRDPSELYGGLCDVTNYEDGNNWRMMRIGPLTSNGGYDWWQFAGHNALNMSDILKHGKKYGINAHYVVGVEAATDKTLGYPPIHVHHIHVVPKKPWLRYQWPSHRLTLKEFGDAMMTSQGATNYLPNYVVEQHGEWDLCDVKEDDPEAGCFAESLPRGYTNIVDFELDVEGEVNDNRETNATDLVWWLEIGLGWTSELENLAPASYMIQGEDQVLMTYGHQYSYENYYWVPSKGQHISYYQATTPTDGTLLRAKYHNHMSLISKTFLINAPASELGLHKLPPIPEHSKYRKFTPCLFDYSKCEKYKYTTTIPVEDFGFDSLDAFEHQLRKRISQLPGGNSSIICEVDTGLTPFGYEHVGEYSKWRWDRAGEAHCQPWKFSKGQQYTSIAFHEFQMPYPGPWEPSGVLPEVMPMHNQWNLVYESRDHASHYFIQSANLAVPKITQAIFKEFFKIHWRVVYANPSAQDKIYDLAHRIRFLPPAFFIALFIIMIGGVCAKLLKRKVD